MVGPLRRGGRTGGGERAQVITFEAITGAIILLLMVLFALQSTVITPLSASTANQQIEEQNRAIADDVLDVAAEQGALTPVVLNWNASHSQFNGTVGSPRPYYTSGVPDRFEFGSLLNQTLTSRDIAYNLYVQYQNGSDLSQTTIVYQGEASYNAATATKTVFLYNSTVDGSGPDRYIPDVEPGKELDNVLRLKIVVWRM